MSSDDEDAPRLTTPHPGPEDATAPAKKPADAKGSPPDKRHRPSRAEQNKRAQKDVRDDAMAAIVEVLRVIAESTDNILVHLQNDPNISSGKVAEYRECLNKKFYDAIDMLQKQL